MSLTALPSNWKGIHKLRPGAMTCRAGRVRGDLNGRLDFDDPREGEKGTSLLIKHRDVAAARRVGKTPSCQKAILYIRNGSDYR